MTDKDVYINKLRDTLSPRQLEVLQYYATKSPRMLILEGAVRSGKTFLNNLLWIEYINRYRDKGKIFIMSGVTRSSLENNVLYDLNRLTEVRGGMKAGEYIPAVLGQSGSFEYLGNRVMCFGTDTVGSARRVKGLTAQGWYANEATKHHPLFIKEAPARCSEVGAKIFWDCNPESPSHFVYTDFIKHSGELLSSGIEAVHSEHFSLDDNPILPIEYIESLKKLTPETSTFYKRNILGLWVASGNIIFDNYKVANFDIDIDEYDEILAGADFGRGGNSESACVLIGRKGIKYYILDEVKALFKTNIEFISAVQAMMDNIKVEAVKDNTMIYADPSDPDKITEFQRNGFHIIGATKGAGSVLAGIELLQATDWTIRENCTMMLAELSQYEWQVEANGLIRDKPVKINDHLIDATRYCRYSKRNIVENNSNGNKLYIAKRRGLYGLSN